MFPEVVLWSRKSNLYKRPPFWPLRFPYQTHVRFAREPVSLASITGDARANDVFPRGRSPAIPRYDMIEIEFAAIENMTAVLAGILVALEHVVPGKFHFLLWKSIENQKHNDPRDSNLERNRRDQFVVGRVCRQTPPAFEIMRHEIVRLIRRNDVGMSRIDQREGPTRGADVHRLPQAVEHQDLTV